MRRLPIWLVLSTGACAGALTVIACSSETTKPSSLEVEDDDGGRTKRDTGTTSSSGGSSGGSSGDPGDLDGATANGRIYAHTPDKLFLFEPVTKKLTEVGAFDCLDGDQMIDIALDRGGAMFGTAFHKFMSIDPTNAKCTVLGTRSPENYPNSLSFVPVGVLDPTKEVLVGYLENTDPDTMKTYKDTYARIDTTNGSLTIIGQAGDLNPPAGLNGKYYDVAGDVIALINDNNKAYVILEDDKYADAGPPTSNHLAEMNPKTGTITKIIGPIGQLKTYGFAYWAGKGYGFSDDGRITEINMATGASTTVLTLDGGSWYGAGVTTDSPGQ